MEPLKIITQETSVICQANIDYTTCSMQCQLPFVYIQYSSSQTFWSQNTFILFKIRGRQRPFVYVNYIYQDLPYQKLKQVNMENVLNSFKNNKLFSFVDYVPVKGEIIWYLSLTAWLISLSIILSSSIHAVAKGIRH